MKFSECIDLALASKKIKSNKAQEAKDAYESAYQDFLSRGYSERAADDRAAQKAVEALGTKVATKQWLKINEIRVAADLYKTFSTTDAPQLELYRLSWKLDVSAKTVVDEAHSMVADLLEKYMPRAAGTWHPVADLDQIIHANHGQPASPEAKALNDAIVKVLDWLRKRKNIEGTNIHQDPDGRISLVQDRRKLAYYARGTPAEAAAAKATWIEEHVDRLDWTRIRDREGNSIPEDEQETFLGKLYNALRTRGFSNREPTAHFEMALAEKLSHPEYFYYKDAESWLEMNEKYGSGNVYQQVMMHIGQASKDIALLKNLGPHPLSAMEFIGNVAGKRAGELDLAAGGKKLEQNYSLTKTLSEFGSLKEHYALFAGNVPGAESLLAQSVGGLKNTVAPLILPKAFISNLGDMFTMWRTMRFHKLPAAKALARLLKNFVLTPSKTRRLEAIRNATGMESAMTTMATMQKYTGVLGDGWRWSNRWADSMFRGAWMVPFTEAERRTVTEGIAAAFADNAHKPFDQLRFKDSLQRFGITPEEWDIFRQTPIFEPDGQHLLRGLDVAKRADLDPVEARRLADKFMDYVNDIGFRAAPQPSTRVKIALGEGVDPNTLRGAELRAMGFVKSFSVMNFMVYMKDAMLLPTRGDRMGALSRYFLAFMFSGAFITQMKLIADGKDPDNMVSPWFWMRAVLNGGAMSFLGDFVFGTLGAYKHGGIGEIAQGPLPQFVDSVWNIAADDTYDYFHNVVTKGWAAANKNYKGVKDAATFAQRYNPIPWQFKLIFQRSLLDDMLKQGNPRAYATLRQQESAAKQQGQGAWWGVGQKSPSRPPNLLSVIGQGNK